MGIKNRLYIKIENLMINDDIKDITNKISKLKNNKIIYILLKFITWIFY